MPASSQARARRCLWCAATCIASRRRRPLSCSENWASATNTSRTRITAHGTKTMEGITKAGYGGTVQAMLCIYNISYGPWQRSAFFRHLQTAAQDMSTSLSPDDALLLRQWPHICAERGWATAAQTGHDAREEFLRSLPLDSAAVVKGPKAATSRHSLLGGGGAAERYDPEHVCNLGRKSAPSRSRLRSMSVRGRLPVASPPEGFCRSSASQTSGLISKRARA